jgi:hypothetical protein
VDEVVNGAFEHHHNLHRLTSFCQQKRAAPESGFRGSRVVPSESSLRRP